MSLNETHDVTLRSWVESAQAEGCAFPIQNLPFAVFRCAGSDEAWRGGVAIGDQVLDLAAAAASGAFTGDALVQVQAAAQDSLNAFMALGPAAWSAFRRTLSRALRTGSASEAALRGCLLAQAELEYRVPTRMGGFTDFFASLYHAVNATRVNRPDAQLVPNYPWVPIAYHSRVSSIRVSGHTVKRPQGQQMLAGQVQPVVAPAQMLDFELELGVYVGTGNALGEPVAIEQAPEHLFGVCLLNDWSARDIQRWEAQPLGPFLAKNFATTISPWVITMEALAPFRAPLHRDTGYEAVLPYLDSARERREGALDIRVQARLQTEAMRETQQAGEVIARTSAKSMFWTPAQMLAHHTVNGCNLEAGDLLGTGTLSGPTAPEACALLELTHGGQQPLQLANGESRGFLHDGDAVIFDAWCEAPGAARIGFGTCEARVQG